MGEMGKFPLGGPILALEGTSGPSLSLPSRPMNKVAIIAEMEILHGIGNTDFYLPRLIWPQLLMNAKSSNCREKH